MPGTSLMTKEKPILTRQQNGNPAAQTTRARTPSASRDRTPSRFQGSSSCPHSPCPYTHENPSVEQLQHVDNAESPIRGDRMLTGQPSSGSGGPPSAGPPGNPATAQHFDIASNGAPNESDSDSSSVHSEDNIPN